VGGANQRNRLRRNYLLKDGEVSSLALIVTSGSDHVVFRCLRGYEPLVFGCHVRDLFQSDARDSEGPAQSAAMSPLRPRVVPVAVPPWSAGR